MKISLTTNDGELIEQWITNEYGDMMRSMPMDLLLSEIKDEIRAAIERGENNDYNTTEEDDE